MKFVHTDFVMKAEFPIEEETGLFKVIKVTKTFDSKTGLTQVNEELIGTIKMEEWQVDKYLEIMEEHDPVFQEMNEEEEYYRICCPECCDCGHYDEDLDIIAEFDED